MVFDQYALYYDLLYADKGYEKEAAYVVKLIHKFSPESSSLLDLGCGTGKHASVFNKKGFSVHGIDRSNLMLKYAQRYEQNDLTFSKSDIRRFNLKKKFDVVTALFHVFSYVNTNEDVLSTLKSVNAHLSRGGLFVFDFWYGPAVLSDLPGVRKKVLDNESLQVTRRSTPAMDVNKNLVNVNFKVSIYDKRNSHKYNLNENHSMRYFFMPEIEYFLDISGFSLLKSYKWLTQKAPGSDSWYVVCVAQKTGK